MAESTVLFGQYGYYFPYKDETGKHGLKILDEVYDKYYKHGYLTDKHLQAMLDGATINFDVPHKDGNGSTTMTAKVIPYINKNGKNCKIIQIDSDQIDDYKILTHNGDKIVTAYWNGTRFDYTKPQEIVDSLNLMHTWKTWSQYANIGNIKFGEIKIYKAKSRSKSIVLLYCKVENDICIPLTEEQYKVEKSKAEAIQVEEHNKRALEIEKRDKVRLELLAWLNDIVNKIWPNGTATVDEMISNSAAIVNNINVANIEDRVAALCSSRSYAMTISKYIDQAKTDIYSKITLSNYSDNEVIQSIKTNLLNNIKVYVEYCKIRTVRTELLNEYNSVGLDTLTSSINIDEALNLGYFPVVQKILVKYKQEAPKYIIQNMYLDILDPKELRDKLLNLLKIYYDFYDMPEKDRKSIAKYIAKNKLSDYYDRISMFDDVLETLIGESRDPKLTKPLLESIAGTSRANCLKDKTFYFEKIGRLRTDILLYKPIELLDRLRSHIKEFNVSSDVAILTNIELNPDESFVFQFYTFAGNNSAEGEFDGRRMLNLTRIYNRHHPNEKIGFYFNNTSNNDE